MKEKNLLKITIFSLLTMFAIVNAKAQTINDNFEDGNLTGWLEGTTGDWINSSSSPITGTQSLRHVDNNIAGSSYIYHNVSTLDLQNENTSWKFNLANGNFDPSGGNRFWVYLTANETDLSSSTVDGYAIGVNLTGTSDILTLWKVTDGNADAAIITSTFNWDSNDTVGIKITRSSTGNWELFLDTDGGFDSLVSAGSNQNIDYTHDGVFGLFFEYTSSRAGLLKLDDVTVEGAIPSTDPTITFDSATSSETETDATFTSANIPISVTNYDGNQIDIDVAITGGTAEPSDYSYTTQSLSFSSDSTQNITIDINDDVDTDDETIIFTITETSSVTGLVISQATHTLTITDDDLPNIIINELLADPGSVVDANGDGIFDSSDDEFIEIVNTDVVSYDLTGYTIEDSSLRYTFGATTIPAGGSVVIFGGGTPTGIPGISDTVNESTILGLANTGDTVYLKNADGTIIATYSYGSEANSDESIGRSPDLTGSFVKHETISSNPVSASPGRYNTTGEPFTTNTWTGATDTSWTEASNWSLGTVPGSGDDVQIINTTNQPLALGAVTVNSVTIASGATLTAQSTFTGSVTYNRSLATDNWYLMSSPVSGEIYDSSWVIDNNIDDTTSSNGNIGIATYTTADDTWSYLQTGGSGAFTNGKGFSIKQDATGTVSFTGTLNTSDVSAAVATGGNDGYNLIGNPFTTNLSSAMFLTGNTANLTSETIWVWNQGTGTYDAYVTGESFILAPTQGFFVSANSATNLTLAESYQTSTAGTFQKSANPKIELYVTDGTNKRFVKMYYNPTATKSFDNGYDGEIFGGIKNSFELYTNLISNNVGKKYQVQSLPNSDLETMVIPVGVKVEANKEITFTAEALNLPSGIKVFLEDRFTNTFTRLDEANSEYKFTSDVALDGTGRFYLHTKSSALNIESLDLDNVSIYKTDNSNLRVVGLSEGKASIKLYNIIGKQVLNSSFTANGVQDITLPSLAKGIYIVQLETETGKLNKKITLE